MATKSDGKSTIAKPIKRYKTVIHAKLHTRFATIIAIMQKNNTPKYIVPLINVDIFDKIRYNTLNLNRG